MVTFDEVLDLLDRLADELHRPVGVLPEVKHSTYFASVGLPVEPALVDTLRRRGRDGADSEVIIQSFETANLRALRTQVACPLLQLVDAAGTGPADLVAAGDPRTLDALVTPEGLRDVAGYATWLGPTKEWIVPLGPDDAAARRRRSCRRARGGPARHALHVPQRERVPARGAASGGRRRWCDAPADTYGDAFAEYAQYARSASTPCSATTRIPRWSGLAYRAGGSSTWRDEGARAARLGATYGARRRSM